MVQAPPKPKTQLRICELTGCWAGADWVDTEYRKRYCGARGRRYHWRHFQHLDDIANVREANAGMRQPDVRAGVRSGAALQGQLVRPVQELACPLRRHPQPEPITKGVNDMTTEHTPGP